MADPAFSRRTAILVASAHLPQPPQAGAQHDDRHDGIRFGRRRIRRVTTRPGHADGLLARRRGGRPLTGRRGVGLDGIALAHRFGGTRGRVLGCRVALKCGTRRVAQRLLSLNMTFRRQLGGVLSCYALQSGQLLQEDGVLLQTHEARQFLRSHRGRC